MMFQNLKGVNKKLPFLVFCLTGLLLHNSCEKKKSIKLLLHKNYTFNVGFDYNYKYAGILKSTKNREELIYFCDFLTAKKIVLFDLNAAKRYEVNLKNIINSGFEVENIAFNNLDSIFLLSKHTNKLLCLNNHGDVMSTLFLDSIIKPKGTDKYEFNNIKVNNKRNLFFACDWIGDSTIENPKLNWEYYEYFFKNTKYKPKLVRLESFNSFKYNIGFDSAHYKVCPTNEFKILIENNKFITFEDKILFYSWYSNKIFILNENSLKLEEAFCVEADDFNVGVNPIFVSERNYNQAFDSVSSNLKRYGMIKNVVYDTYRKNLCVVVCSNENEKTKKRKFALIIYNQKFEKIYDEEWDTKNIGLTNILVTKNGLLISNKSNNELNSSTASYGLYKYEN